MRPKDLHENFSGGAALAGYIRGKWTELNCNIWRNVVNHTHFHRIQQLSVCTASTWYCSDSTCMSCTQHTGVDSPGSTVIRAPGYEGNTKVCVICCSLSWKCLFWEILVGMCLQFLCWVTSLLAGSYTGRKGPIVLSPGRHCSGFWRRSLFSAAKPWYSTVSSLSGSNFPMAGNFPV